jgi:hypothetical protein
VLFNQRVHSYAAAFEKMVGLMVEARGEYIRCRAKARAPGVEAVITAAMDADPKELRDLGMQHPLRKSMTAAYMKAAVAPGTTTDSTWAQPLVAFQTLASAWFESLRSISMLDALLTDARRIPQGVRFAVTTATAAGNAVAQGAWTPVSKMSFVGDNLTPKKALALVVVDEALIELGGALAQNVLAAELRLAVALAGDAVVAAALLAGITPAASTGDARHDLRVVLAAVPLKQSSKPYVLTSPDAVKQLALLGVTDGPPAFPDASIPGGGSVSGMPLLGLDILSGYPGGLGDLLLVVDAAQCAGDSGDIVLTVSDQGTIQMSDSPSGPADEVSLFQTNSIALKGDREFVFDKVRTNAVAAIKNVNYAP